MASPELDNLKRELEHTQALAAKMPPPEKVALMADHEKQAAECGVYLRLAGMHPCCGQGELYGFTARVLSSEILEHRELAAILVLGTLALSEARKKAHHENKFLWIHEDGRIETKPRITSPKRSSKRNCCSQRQRLWANRGEDMERGT